MPTSSDQASGQEPSLADQFASLTGEQIYDSIMSGIEPELVLANLESLDAPYASESAEEHTARYARYGKAFAQYAQKYALFISSLSNAVHVYKRAVLQAAEHVTGSKESELLQGLSDQMEAL